MAFETPKINYNGRIKEITLGEGPKAVTVGGETSMPFYLFEGEMPRKPKIAMEIQDTPPEDWPEDVLKPFGDAVNNPVSWAKKCVDTYGAELICLQLESTDPNGLDRSAEEAAKIVREVADAVDVPLIVWGTANHEKDTEVLRKASEACPDKKLILGPVEEGDYKKIAAQAMAYKHTIIASSPIDINLAKQLNILLGNLGVPAEGLIMDPTVSSIGYGIEYSYSVIERIRLAALTQQDERLQYPLICNIGREAWKTKEAKIPEAESPEMGNTEKRAIMIEAMSAAILLIAGADILVMRHPESMRLAGELIAELS
ncbi:acetyl-CoA synthase subunit delta [Dehalococcoides mccartyi CG4]|uniref:acetyl-CoA decarbonylase/synthase complex subunit delta n=1 Tax=Dehalococcoides mccartyi TaxID=61435 RepID=UPI0004E0466E|nr:acetyl-CoA decarbonylase/synthase complex subunit delta [Dehalococcoides mccartyi]AII59341.1 acetyl-CoA synthase subunit delta [Dehalococcoides mccartyi CG4]